jgi:hypothetical protein
MAQVFHVYPALYMALEGLEAAQHKEMSKIILTQ